MASATSLPSRRRTGGVAQSSALMLTVVVSGTASVHSQDLKADLMGRSSVYLLALRTNAPHSPNDTVLCGSNMSRCRTSYALLFPFIPRRVLNSDPADPMLTKF